MPDRTRLTALIVIPSIAIACVVFALIGWFQSGQTGRQFGEGRIGTLTSVLVLAGSGVVALRISALPSARGFRWFWLVFASLLLFAAADDMFKIHEQLDVVVNRALGADPEDPRFDRLDDLIVVLYAGLGCGGLGLLYKRQLLELRWMARFLAVGGVLFTAMVACDTLHLGIALEESLKLLSGAFIFTGIAAAEHQLAGLPAPAPAPIRTGSMAPPGLEPGCPSPDRGF